MFEVIEAERGRYVKESDFWSEKLFLLYQFSKISNWYFITFPQKCLKMSQNHDSSFENLRSSMDVTLFILGRLGKVRLGW